MFHAIQLSKSDPTPLYMQLASELASLIQSNVLPEGFKLPTIRMLSKQLLINRDTVVSAYKLLEQQGFVESHIGKGTYITSHNIPPSTPVLSPDSFHSPLCCSQLKLSASFFPTALCQALTQEIIDKEGWEAFSDPLFRHRTLLKQSISNFFNQLGIKNHFAQIKITSNFNEFLLSLFRFFPKTGICVESIRDLSISCELRSFGAKIHEIPLTDEGMDLDILEKHLRTGTISYIIVTPYLHNPTGLCYSTENKRSLLRLASEYDCYIIEDGSQCEYVDSTLSYLPIINLSEKDRVIYMYPFSKFYLPAMKYYFFILPSLFNARINEDPISSFNERFLYYYLESEVFCDLLTTLKAIFKVRYHQVIEALTSSHSPLQLTYTRGGTFLWLKILPNDYQSFLNDLTSKQVIVAPGDLFCTSPLTHFLRLSFGELTNDGLEKVIQMLLNDGQ